MTARFRPARLLALLCLALTPLLTACPQPPVDTPPPVSVPSGSEQVWLHYLERAEIAENRAVAWRIRATVQYETPDNKGHRMNAILWGNPDLPIRLDIFAGVGAMVAQVREDRRSFLLHMPEQRVAYAHQGSNKPYLNIGTPLPFTLERLTYLLCGRFEQVFGLVGTPLNSSGTLDFVLNAETAPVQGVLRLAQDGRVLRWDGSPPSGKPGGIGYGWNMDVDYAEGADAFQLPRRLTLTHESGYSAVLLVKSREALPAPFEEERLKLDLPPQTEIRHFEEAP